MIEIRLSILTIVLFYFWLYIVEYVIPKPQYA